MPETSPRQSSDKIALKAYLPNLKLLYAMNSENEYFKNTRKELDE